MPRMVKVALVVLAVAVVIGLISIRGLRRHVQRLAQAQSSEEQARHQVLAPPIATASDVITKANVFWAAGQDKVAPVEIQLPLSADPVERSRQLLQALITNPPTPGQRTLPASTSLLGFYLLPDGTAVADFSDTLSSEMPSGIVSETMAVNSITRTLAANVSALRRLKILIHGQEVETFAGHADLTGYFDLNPNPPQSSTAVTGGAAPATSVPTAATTRSKPAAPSQPVASGAKPTR
jgi:sporulation and spore germination protein